MKYKQHVYNLGKPSSSDELMGEAPAELHALLKSKGFVYLSVPAYYCYGKDEEWYGKEQERPWITVFPGSGTWDSKPVPGYSRKPDDELKKYLESLPDHPSLLDEE